MLAVLKHPAAADMIPQIATLLTDLGATQAEVNRAMPKPAELAASRKRKAESEAEKQRNKKFSKTDVRKRNFNISCFSTIYRSKIKNSIVFKCEYLLLLV